MSGGIGAGVSARLLATQLVRIIMAIVLATASACSDPPPPVTALWFGGDVHLGASTGGGLGNIAPSLAGAEGIVNLEGPIAVGEGSATVTPAGVILTNPANAADRLRALGIGAVTFTNNHTSDAGDEGLIRTVAALNAARLGPAAPRSYTLFAYDLEDPAVPVRLAADLDAAGGLRVVSLHVTGPASYLPRPELIRAVDAAVAHGADIVVAQGTHVIGPVERRGEAVIVWGLGNLFFSCSCTREDEAILVRVSLEAGHAAQVIPIRAGLDGADATLSSDPAGVFDLLEGLGSTALEKHGAAADF